MFNLKKYVKRRQFIFSFIFIHRILTESLEQVAGAYGIDTFTLSVDIANQQQARYVFA